ncbi:PrsW family intramembrane metalloprotease [Niastella caeni]|uniref:PrsW family intramembrane metalloprotease n=1 Tax=Niastella caeni TaxID=2569763 RepID=A0A4S8HV19_9BACT|nr:PrsW family glutamic-type intramembrane protease [Niastella caeni]THU39453.1 PrsW family intramembrane metalloprotease [Niastella caeni]
MLSLLALAIAPGAAITLYIYSRDKYDREPLKPLLISFLLGMVATAPAILIQTSLKPVLFLQFPDFTVWYYFLLSFIVVAVSEEGSKYVMLRFYAYRNKAFNEPFDGIIYSVMISMGFATLENIGYVLNYGFKTGIIRMFLSVPLHGAFAVLMGYHVGLAKFDPARAIQHIVKGLLLAMFFHGAFDFFLMLQNSEQVKQHVSNGLLIGGALTAWGIAIRMSVKSIRLHESHSKQNFHKNNETLSEV